MHTMNRAYANVSALDHDDDDDDNDVCATRAMSVCVCVLVSYCFALRVLTLGRSCSPVLCRSNEQRWCACCHFSLGI